MPEIYSPTGTGTFGQDGERSLSEIAFTEWQAHLDAARLNPRKPTPPHIRALHRHNHRVLGLRFPGGK